MLFPSEIYFIPIGNIPLRSKYQIPQREYQNTKSSPQSPNLYRNPNPPPFTPLCPIERAQDNNPTNTLLFYPVWCCHNGPIHPRLLPQRVRLFRLITPLHQACQGVKLLSCSTGFGLDSMRLEERRKYSTLLSLIVSAH